MWALLALRGVPGLLRHILLKSSQDQGDISEKKLVTELLSLGIPSVGRHEGNSG